MLLTWREELRQLCDCVPEAAANIVDSIDTGRFNGAFYNRCAYGSALGFHRDQKMTDVSAYPKVHPLRLKINGHDWFSALEGISLRDPHLIREECVLWLAEHGTAVGGSHALSPT